jgi:hypothetical protein
MVMWLRTLVLFGGLCAGTALPAASLEQSLGEAQARLDELGKLIAEKPAALRVRLPNSRDWESLEASGLAPMCRKPVLVRPAAPVRAMTQCVGMHLGQRGLMQVTASIFWTHDQRWQHGHVLRLQTKSMLRGEGRLDDADLVSAQPVVQAMAGADADELKQLQQLWDELRKQHLPAPPEGEWGASTPWPDGLVALHGDGRLKLAGNRLAGLRAWQDWWAAQPRAEGVAAVVGVRRQLGGKSPALQLAELSLAGTPFAAVLLPVGQQPGEEFALWHDDNWQLLMVRTDGK